MPQTKDMQHNDLRILAVLEMGLAALFSLLSTALIWQRLFSKPAEDINSHAWDAIGLLIYPTLTVLLWLGGLTMHYNTRWKWYFQVVPFMVMAVLGVSIFVSLL